MNKLLIALCLTITGCSSLPIDTYTPKSVKIDYPVIGDIAIAYIGDDLVVQGFKMEFDAIRIDSDVTIKSGMNHNSIDSGVYLKVGANKDETIYTSDPLGGKKPSVKISKNPHIAVVIEKGKSGVCAKFSNGFATGNVCNESASFTNVKQVVSTAATFQQTLIYNGKVGNKLNVGYRESKNHMARDAYSNDAEYDLTDSMIIGYKGATIEVIEANNSYIKYRLLKNFK